jgi:hypothetical protein
MFGFQRQNLFLSIPCHVRRRNLTLATGRVHRDDSQNTYIFIPPAAAASWHVDLVDDGLHLRNLRCDSSLVLLRVAAADATRVGRSCKWCATNDCGVCYQRWQVVLQMVVVCATNGGRRYYKWWLLVLQGVSGGSPAKYGAPMKHRAANGGWLSYKGRPMLL